MSIGQSASFYSITNATPWTHKEENKPEHPLNQVLDVILPLDRQAKAAALVSTEHTNRYPSIPSRNLARRVSNVDNDYIKTSDSPKAVLDNTPQPQHSDLELSETGGSLPYIKKIFDAPEDNN